MFCKENEQIVINATAKAAELPAGIHAEYQHYTNADCKDLTDHLLALVLVELKGR